MVATPIGNLSDFSPRAAACLEDVDEIVAEDTRHTGRLLAHFGISTRTRALHEHNERALAPVLAEQIAAGRNIAIVSDAGTPLISDPGYVLVGAVQEAGGNVVAIPGPSAITAALSISGLPTDRFAFEGFLPARAKARVERLRTLSAETRTWVCYESPHRIAATLADVATVFGGDHVIAVAKELTKLNEQVCRGSVDEVIDWLGADPNRTRGEFVLMVSGVAKASASGPEVDALLVAALEELPPARAARMLARATGESRKRLYRRALELAQADDELGDDGGPEPDAADDAPDAGRPE